MSSIFRVSDAAVLVSSPSSTDKKDGVVMVSVEPERDDHLGSDATDRQPKNPIVRLLESSFLGPMKKGPVEEEMMEIHEGVRIVQSPKSKSCVGDFDSCREYSYSGDEDEHIYYMDGKSGSLADLSSEQVTLIHVLGRTYHPIHDYARRRADEASLFWFTYRCDFPEITPYGINSDAGWGCMLRSAMMLLAQALRLHYKGRDWKLPQQLTRRRLDPFVRSLLTWFADFPSTDSNLYSLHNMVAAGLDRQVLPGEWYGPGTACYVLRDLVEMHEKLQNSVQQKANNKRIFRVHVAANASLYKSAVEELMTNDSRSILQHHRAQKASESRPAHPFDNTWECELIELESKIQWDTSLLLLIPLRLGLKSFNPRYVETMAHMFSLSQSVGTLGGRPRGARWFYGASDDGSKIFGLDPHTVQTAPRKRRAVVNGELSQVVELSDDYLRSVHTTFQEDFSLLKMDPSIALGFYCKDRNDFLDLLFSLENWKKEHPDLPELLSVSDSVPDYSTNVSSVMDDMMANSLNDMLMDDDKSGGSDEDDYVVL